MPIRNLALLTVAAIAFGYVPASGQNASPADSAAQRAEAIELYKQSKYLEALPLFEKLVVAYPEDKLMHEGLGVSLVGQAATLTGGESDALRVRARQEFLRARELGDNSDIVAVELELLPPKRRASSHIQQARSAGSDGPCGSMLRKARYGLRHRGIYQCA